MMNIYQIKGLIYLFLLYLLTGTLVSCSRRGEVVTDEIVPVRVSEVKLQNIQRTLDYAGDIVAQDEALIYPKVSGKIIRILKDEGATVKKGTPIGYVDRDEVGFDFKRAPIESPLGGVIGRILVERGTNVNPQTPVGLVVDIDKVRIALDIPEKYLPLVSLGQTAKIKVDAYPDVVITGEVSKMSPVVDLDTRTAPIEILIPNPRHILKPGMFARVQLIIEEKDNVPVILKEALIGKGEYVFVYVVKNGIAEQRKVSLGIRQGADYQVTAGLSAGELVVIMGQQKLHNGVAVSTEREEGVE